MFGVRKFHAYLLGHPFELVTDHKPLLCLLGEGKASSQACCSARVRRWSLFLSSYEYEMTFRKTQAHGNADALSRLPTTVELVEEEDPPELVLLMVHLHDSPSRLLKLSPGQDETHPWHHSCRPFCRVGQKRESQSWNHFIQREVGCLCSVVAFFGDLGWYSVEGKGGCHARAACWASRHVQDEELGPKVCMVAWHRRSN